MLPTDRESTIILKEQHSDTEQKFKLKSDFGHLRDQVL